MSIPTRIPVSVILVNFNTKELTKKALEALFRSHVQPTQIILVDNNSKDGSVDMVKSEFPDVFVIANTENVGFAKANNQAIRQVVDQPYIWLLNSDTETGPNSLGELYAFIEAHPKAGAVGPQLIYPTRAWQSVGGFFPSPINVFRYLLPITWFFSRSFKQKLKNIALFPQPLPKEGRRLDYVTGAASLLRKKALDEVGLLAEDFFMYFEETDLCWRLSKKGWEVWAVDTDPVMHVYGGSFKTKYDKRRLALFLDSLGLFVDKNYFGFRKYCIKTEIVLFGWLSLQLKKVKSFI